MALIGPVSGNMSGSLTHLGDGTSYLIAGSNVTITTGSNDAVTIASSAGSGSPGGSNTQVQFNDSDSFGGDAGLIFNKTTDSLTAGNIAVTTALSVGDAITGSLYVPGGAENDIQLTSGTTDYADVGHDHFLFVSGAIGGKALGTGVAVFGGDLVSSGAVIVESDLKIAQYLKHVGDEDTYIEFDTDSLHLAAGGLTGFKLSEATTDQVLIGSEGTAASKYDQVLILSGGAAASTDESAFSDVSFFVSGTVGSQNSSTRGVTLIGGDLVVSGVHHGGYDSDAGASYHNVVTDVVWICDRNGLENDLWSEGGDTNFAVSGAIGSMGNNGLRGTAVFGGDMYVSGAMLVENHDTDGGSISGSIHHTAGGLSYLAAGSNVTITSGTNGQVTIAASGGGGSVAGSDTQVQYNNGGSFGDAADLTFNDTTGDVTVGASTGDAKLFFRDSGNYLYSNADGDFDIVNADGTTADSIKIASSVGGLTLTGSTGVVVHSTGGTILTSGSAVDIDASGLISITSAGGGVDVDAAGATSIDGASGINIGTAADVAIDIDSAALDIDASGAITIDGTSTFSVDAVGASNITTNGALVMSGSTGVSIMSTGGALVASGTSVNIDASSTVDIDGASGINLGKAADVAFDIDTAALDIDSSGAITIDGTSTFSVDAVGASNITTNGALALSGSTGVSIMSTGGALVASGTSVNIDASSTVDIDGAGGINIGKATDVAFDIDTSTLDIDSSGAITIDGTSTFSIDGVGASNVTTNGALTLSGSTGVTIETTGGTSILSGSAGVSIISTAGDITLHPGGGDVLPDGDSTRNLGSAAKRWANIYTGDLHLQNERGNWTVIEETSYLSLRNNATGKVYRILMEEVDE